MVSRILLLQLGFCCVVLSSLWNGIAVADYTRPNILLIVADDLGFSDLGCYGGEINTPHLDRLCERGVQFTQFYTTSRCCPSRACLMTGQYPHAVGLGHMIQDLEQPGYRGRVREGVPTIADRLMQAGYRNYISGKWHLGTSDPTQHGFEEHFGTLTSAKSFWKEEQYLRLPEGRPRREYGEGEFYGTVAITDYAIDFLQEHQQHHDQPWFLYLAYNSPHFPLQAPKERIDQCVERYQAGWDAVRKSRYERQQQLGLISNVKKFPERSPFWDWGEFASGQNPAWDTLPSDRQADLIRRMAIYAAMVEIMDEQIGRLLQTEVVQAEIDNTLIMFTSDNGACAEWDPFGFDFYSGRNNVLHWKEKLDEMGQAGTFHGIGSGWANASNTPLSLYKHYCHEGGISVPMIVHWPRKIHNKGDRCERPSHLIDLMPTVLAAVDAESSQNGPGIDLVSLTQENAAGEDERMLFFEHEQNRAVRAGRWKLTALRNEDWKLYDISIDRAETHDISAQHPDVVRRMKVAWDEWAQRNHVLPFPSHYNTGYLPIDLVPGK
ncbi:arylsulfatase [Calycomorphotria hydatis]|uniref:Arylsulfatase n=1 Tax=Calycomorphotria hydatis TaxID=2528027 RepID=A0A517T403_9PLAN|nr:arylsulfatase [Calycomorphotria hydatis]QDT63102.1 Arylsulfatase [Calycomorphotria hydatis]